MQLSNKSYLFYNFADSIITRYEQSISMKTFWKPPWWPWKCVIFVFSCNLAVHLAGFKSLLYSWNCYSPLCAFHSLRWSSFFKKAISQSFHERTQIFWEHWWYLECLKGVDNNLWKKIKTHFQDWKFIYLESQCKWKIIWIFFFSTVLQDVPLNSLR